MSEKFDRGSAIEWLAKHKAEQHRGVSKWDKRVKNEDKYVDETQYWFYHDLFAKYPNRKLKKKVAQFMMYIVS